MQPVLAKRDEWTLDDLEALDVPDWWRYEIVDGTLVVSPSAGNDHERVAALLRRTVQEQLPAELLVVGPLGVSMSASYLIPDLLVVAEHRLRDPSRLLPSEVLLAVEIVSPGSRTMDRLVKPAQYAAAGIEHFWRVELSPLTLVAHEVDGDVYRETGRWVAGQTAVLETPFPVRVELDRLQ